MSAILEKLTNEAHAAFRGLVSTIADGVDVPEKTIRETLALAGRSFDDLNSQVESLKAARKEAAEVEAEREAVNAELTSACAVAAENANTIRALQEESGQLNQRLAKIGRELVAAESMYRSKMVHTGDLARKLSELDHRKEKLQL